MIAHISGVNRAEFFEVKRKKDFSRVFFMTRQQLYRVSPNGLTRVFITHYGKERPSDAIISYKENEIIPYDTKGLDYCMDNFLADIDRYKLMTDYSWFKKNRPWIADKASDLWKFATSGGGMVIAVLIYVFINGGA